MPGVLLAARQVPSRPGLTVGLEHLLGILMSKVVRTRPRQAVRSGPWPTSAR